MATSLQNLVNNPTEGVRRSKFKYGQYNKKCGTCGIKYKDCECSLEYKNIKDDFIVCKMFLL